MDQIGDIAAATIATRRSNTFERIISDAIMDIMRRYGIVQTPELGKLLEVLATSDIVASTIDGCDKSEHEQKLGEMVVILGGHIAKILRPLTVGSSVVGNAASRSAAAPVAKKSRISAYGVFISAMNSFRRAKLYDLGACTQEELRQIWKDSAEHEDNSTFELVLQSRAFWNRIVPIVEATGLPCKDIAWGELLLESYEKFRS